jgi:hypothetical protein
LFSRPPAEFLRDGRPLGGDVDWASFPWPEPGTYDRAAILRALRAVMSPHPRDWSDPATMVRFAVGNDHRGTVYPAAVAMTSQLLTIAADFPGDPRQVALCILDEWWSGYEPETGFESYPDADGTRVAVIPEMARRIAGATDLLTRIATRSPTLAEATLASNLLRVIPRGWGHTVDEDGTIHSWGGHLDENGVARFPEAG